MNDSTTKTGSKVFEIGGDVVSDPMQVYSVVRKFLNDKGILDPETSTTEVWFQGMTTASKIRTRISEALARAEQDGELKIGSEGGPCGSTMQTAVDKFFSREMTLRVLKVRELEDVMPDVVDVITEEVLMSFPEKILEIINIIYRRYPDKAVDPENLRRFSDLKFENGIDSFEGRRYFASILFRPECEDAKLSMIEQFPNIFGSMYKGRFVNEIEW